METEEAASTRVVEVLARVVGVAAEVEVTRDSEDEVAAQARAVAVLVAVVLVAATLVEAATVEATAEEVDQAAAPRRHQAMHLMVL